MTTHGWLFWWMSSCGAVTVLQMDVRCSKFSSYMYYFMYTVCTFHKVHNMSKFVENLLPVSRCEGAEM